METYKIESNAFKRYGQVLEGYNFESFIDLLEQSTPVPEDGFVYRASDPMLEKHRIFEELKNCAYGGMPIQLGYCNGKNTKLNCLEYHKTSEICIMADDTILLLGLQSDIEDWQYDTAKVKAFYVPAGAGVELFSTTLHYAPCHIDGSAGYRVANCLPKGTNAETKGFPCRAGEDRLLMAHNKWLLAHKESDEAKKGAYIGLYGENIDIQVNIG